MQFYTCSFLNIDHRTPSMSPIILTMFKNKQLYRYLVAFLLGASLSIAIFISIVEKKLINNNQKNFLGNQDRMVIDLSIADSKNDRIIATVDGKPVYLREAESELKLLNQNVNFGNLEPEVKKLLVEEIVAQKLILQAALKDGVQKEDDNLIKDFAIAEIKQKYLTKKAAQNVTEEKIKNQYNKLLKEIGNKDEFKIKHILAKNLKEANEASAYLSKYSFEEAAKKYSIDEQSAKNGGDIGYIVEGSSISEIDQQIKKLQLGQVSKPFESKLGWHIIKLEQKRKVVVAKYEDAKQKIKDALIEDAKKEYVKSLIENSKIEIIQKN